jgi:hypothetical protein
MLLRLLIIGSNTPFRLSATLRRWDHDDEPFFPGGGLEWIVERHQRQ